MKDRAMPEKFKDTFNLPIAIPVWGLVTFIAGGVFYAGATLNKLNTLLENYSKTETKVSVIQDRQIANIAAVQNLSITAQHHENRITNLEIAVRK
jgi:hypothetical protein